MDHITRIDDDNKNFKEKILYRNDQFIIDTYSYPIKKEESKRTKTKISNINSNVSKRIYSIFFPTVFLQTVPLTRNMGKFFSDIFNILTLRRCYYESSVGLFNMYKSRKKCYSLFRELLPMDFVRILFLTIVVTYVLYRYGVLYLVEKFQRKPKKLLIHCEPQLGDAQCKEEVINVPNENKNNNSSDEKKVRENVEEKKSPNRKLKNTSTNEIDDMASVSSSMPSPNKKVEIGTHMTRIVSPRPIICSYCLRESDTLNEMGQTIYTFFRCHHFYCGKCLSIMNVHFCPKCRRGLIV
ncbi:hypothetical protein SNEBB_002716 [Seison nebaliae]|nr:hypothetical protein SNEBB_002716 [Seison nebaliae]